MPGETKAGSPNIPSNDDIEKAAEFWDTHSPFDFDCEVVEDAKVEREKEELVSVSVRLPKSDVEKLKAAAGKLGLGYTTFVRMILRREIGSK